MRNEEKINILIVTAADGEDEAVKRIFGDGWTPMELTSQVNLYWDKKTLISKQNHRFTVGLVRSNMGTESAGTIVTTLFHHLQPNFVAMCGICAGHPEDTGFGDVIIADKVFRYDQKSVKRLFDDFVEENPDLSTYSIAMSWWQLAQQRLKVEGIKIHIGPIATAETLQRDSTIWDKIRKNTMRKCIGLDMEASVIGHIGHVMERQWVVIKGVSDHATLEKSDEFHTLAKENAAKVLKEFLEIVADQLPKIDTIGGIWLPSDTVDVQTLNPKNNAPSTLLHAKNENVPFLDDIRQQEIKALQALCWSDSTTRGIIQLFTGPGGIGKTRLMIEWIRRLKIIDPSWQDCFLMQGIDPNSQDFKDIFSQNNHLFFVIDYAECRTNLSAILRILVAAATEKTDRMIRVALVARQSGVWWKELASNNLDISGYLHDHVVELQHIPTQGDMRQRLFDSAFQVFAEKTGNLSNNGTKTRNYAILTDPIFGRVLYIQMAAYASVMGLDFTAKNLLDAIVNHEKQFWIIQFGRKIDGDQSKAKFIRETARVLTALTLFGGVDSNEKLTNLINTSKGPTDDLFLEFLLNFYPSTYSNKIVGYLEPDLLGEHLVFDTLCSLRNQKIPFTDTVFLTNTFNITNDPYELQQAFTVLGRIAEHDSCKTDLGKAMINEWLSLPFDESHINVRFLPAINAAFSLAEKTVSCPIADLLTDALEKCGSFRIASAILGKLPEDTVAFRRLKCWKAETFLKYYKDIEHPTEEQQSGYAETLLYYGKVLNSLGRRGEALKVTQEAVDKYRSLVISHPDTFLPGLAGSLINMGATLCNMGMREEALDVTKEAVDVFRSLVVSNPNSFLHELALGLRNLGQMFCNLGMREEALEAAEEAVDKYRSLVASNPDTFLHELAMSLRDLGGVLGYFGKYEKALEVIREAVEILRHLAALRLDAVFLDLAGCLCNIGSILICLGKREEALEFAREAEAMHRKLIASASYSIDFSLGLAKTLNVIGSMYCDLNQYNEALETFREIVKIRRHLVEFYPDTFYPDLAKALDNFGVTLSLLGRHEEALEVFIEMVKIRRYFAQRYPNAFLPDLAVGLNNLGATLNYLDRHEEAQDAYDEANILIHPPTQKSS